MYNRHLQVIVSCLRVRLACLPLWSLCGAAFFIVAITMKTTRLPPQACREVSGTLCDAILCLVDGFLLGRSWAVRRSGAISQRQLRGMACDVLCSVRPGLDTPRNVDRTRRNNTFLSSRPEVGWGYNLRLPFRFASF